MLNDYLLAAGIDRANCYVTNVVRTFEGDDEVTDTEIERDMPDLKAELLKCRPKYIGLLGRVAVDVMLPSVPDRELYWMHGLMFREQMPWGHVKVMPIYHPAAGMHQTSIQGSTAYDFDNFGKMLRGEKVPEYKERHTQGVYSTLGGVPTKDVAIDTEGSVKHPWCLSWSGRANEAWVCRQPLLQPHQVDNVVLHHALWDLAVLKAMGITVTRFEDTLLKACLLGYEPHGLKDLARRHLGMKMKSYTELTAVANRDKAVAWLGEALLWLDNHYPNESVLSPIAKPRKSGGKRLRKILTVTAS